MALDRGDSVLVLAMCGRPSFFGNNGLDVRFVISDQGLSKYAGAKARKVTIKLFWRTKAGLIHPPPPKS